MAENNRCIAKAVVSHISLNKLAALSRQKVDLRKAVLINNSYTFLQANPVCPNTAECKRVIYFYFY
jgi:hypothetical protein